MKHSLDLINRLTGLEIHLYRERAVLILDFHESVGDLQGPVIVKRVTGNPEQIQERVAGIAGVHGHSPAHIPIVL